MTDFVASVAFLGKKQNSPLLSLDDFRERTRGPCEVTAEHDKGLL